MGTKYCEFEPSQHRNKRVASFVFLDEPDDPHPLAICDVCIKKLKQMRPDAVVRSRKEQEAVRKEAREAKQEKAPEPADAEEGASHSSEAPSS